MRQVLKGDAKIEGQKRAAGIIKPIQWKDGKALTSMYHQASCGFSVQSGLNLSVALF